MLIRVNIVIIVLLATVLLNACGNHVWHYVRKGETLYSISFRYGQDYREVARWNQISSPYLISPGQRLRVSPPLGSTMLATDDSAAVSGMSRAEQGPQPTHLENNRQSAVDNTSTGSLARGPSSPHYPQKVTWMWPVKGRIIQLFSSKQPGPKGIDIAGRKGQSVRAAAAGRVVYAGKGLPTYGRLIIIKHNDQFLSAYAHNQKLLVEEGQNVTAGSVIAEMGDSGTDRVKLHFEVRKHGRPVNPLHYLPKR
jgi:lipoprotein NlpD